MASKRLLHIDCLRGYAILMVIACHTAAQFQELPWRVKQVLSSGWNGVQLFFIASTFTLLLSFDAEIRKRGAADWVNFFIRRFFRIAPAYYLAAFVYVALDPTRIKSIPGVVSFATLLGDWLPLPIGQHLVPGGWSITAEFSFYLVFPLFALYAHSRGRAFGLFCLSIILAITGNTFAAELLSSHLPPAAIGNYQFFSFWNQLPVFAFANLVYHSFYHSSIERPAKHSVRMESQRAMKIIGVVLLLVIAAFLPLPRSFSSTAPWMPNFFFCSLLLAGFCLLVSGDRPKLIVNGAVARIGMVSFSAYLWHWLALDVLNRIQIGQWLFSQTRYSAIGAFVIAYLSIVILTWAIASVSYRLVEQPGVAVSRRVIQKRRSIMEGYTTADHPLATCPENSIDTAAEDGSA